MNEANAAMIQRVLDREGGYCNVPGDAGGCTNGGITLATLRFYRRDQSLTCDAVRALTDEEMAAIYEKLYMENPGIAQLADAALRELLFDSAIQHGPREALADGRFYCIEWLQRALGVAADRVMGPQTLAAFAQANSRAIFAEVYRQRLVFYARIVVNNTVELKFLDGWMNRMGALLGTCLEEMA